MLSATDPRVQLIANCIRNVCPKDYSVETLSNLHENIELEKFLEDGNYLLFEANFVEEKIVFSNVIQYMEDSVQEIHFLKTKPISIDETNFSKLVLIGSLHDTPAHTLLFEIKNIYGPLLLANKEWSEKFSPILKHLLNELEVGLAKFVNREKSTTGNPLLFLTPQEEITWWAEVAQTDQKNQKASKINEIFFEFAAYEEFQSLEKKSLDDILYGQENLIEKIKEMLEQLWLANYEEKRMNQFLTTIAAALGRFLILKLEKLQFWNDSFFVIRSTLEKALEICYEWLKTTSDLTGFLWNERNHKWIGKPHQDSFLLSLSKRFEEILYIRGSYEKVAQQFLKGNNSNISIDSDSVFSHFANINPLLISSYTQDQWDYAVKQFEALMSPVESRISQVLKLKFNALKGKPQMLISEYTRNKELIMRPTIFAELSVERTELLAELRNLVKEYKNEFQLEEPAKQSVASVEEGAIVSENVVRIHKAAQYKTKLESVLHSTELFLTDCSEKEIFAAELTIAIKETKDYCEEEFAEWKRKTDVDIKKNNLGKELKGPMVRIENKKLQVNYSEKLVTLIRDVRQLSVLKFVIPDSITKMTDMAQEYYVHAVSLKQIANFYNTVHTQVLKSQSEMLLKSATKFDSIIQEYNNQQKSWDKIDSEQFISKLRTAAENFTSENRKLRKQHLVIGERVVQLMGIDLLRDKERWMEKVKEIRGILKFLDKDYESNMFSWKKHWDYQLYKALEHQYQIGLESLNEHLQQLKVDLVFKDRRLQFLPPFEKIRQMYYEKIRDFISFPDTFQGVNKSSIFRQMIDLNHEGLKTVYSKAQSLFKRLSKLLKQLSSYVVLGTVDLEQIVEESLTDVADWEANFKLMKEKAKEVEKIESIIKIDCVIVSTEQLKATIEDQIQNLGDVLVKTLKKSTLSHVQKLEAFVSSSLEKLSKDPQSMEEIGKMYELCRRIIEEKNNLVGEFELYDRKNKMLKSVAGFGIDASSVLDKWNDFEDTIRAHEIYLKDKSESLKKDVENKIIQFRDKFVKFALKWSELKPSTNFVNKDQAAKEVSFIKDKRAEFEEYKRQESELKQEAQYFDIKVQKFSDIEDFEKEIQKYELIWGVFEKYTAELNDITKNEWITFKKQVYIFEDFITKWQVLIKKEEKNSVTVHIIGELDTFMRFKNILKFMFGDGWTQEHWAHLFKLLNIDKKINLEILLFKHLLDARHFAVDKEEEIRNLNLRAIGEDSIRKALLELKIWETSCEFILFEHVDGNIKTPLIKEWRDIMGEVSDNQALLRSLQDSEYIDTFLEEVGAWELKLTTLEEFLSQLNSIQRKWVYLEPVFNKGALPSEQQRFNKADREFKQIMLDIELDRRVVQLAKRPLKEKLKLILAQLEVCQKALNEFLEEKRNSFPRFYFIGDEDLLEILGQPKNPIIINTHVKKLFAGVHSVVFDSSKTSIESVCSSEGEILKLEHPIFLSEKVDEWLSKLTKEISNTLLHLAEKCDSSEDFNLDMFPEQILCLCLAVNFTRKCEDCIRKNSLPSYLKELRQQLSDFTSLDAKSNYILELKLKCLILDVIHFIEIVEQLIESNVKSTADWSWQKQLRFYIDKSSADTTFVVKMCNASFRYTFEYQGNVSKLVYTPLTDKCYLTLTQGMHLGFGGNPYGPAGTGKTESVKALGHEFGRFVLVFNCDEGIDFKSMGRIFIGIVKCGAWGCFDEFNRLKEDQLSAISQQIQVIQAAIKEKNEKPVEILGKEVLVDGNAGIFVTLNPASKGYGGRSKLPDNLKQLFRSVAMSAPDNDQIAEVILFSEGFTQAKILGKKLVSIFVLCRQLLSAQQHYDWGLRALKTVLRLGGSLIKRERQSGANTISLEIESQLIIKALRVNTVPKLTFEDSKLFNDIVRDVFPQISNIPEISYAELEKHIRIVYEELGLVMLDTQFQKILQFYESCNQRIGVVLVGPSGSGKSTVWKVLMKALQKMGKTLVHYVVNPKSISRNQLLGHLNQDTREWHDGILTSSARRIDKEPLSTQSWFVSDGDIDPEWIESLNSVLDDNHLLTMPNGERIQFTSNVNFVFETHSLKYASPATISRMGMIFFSEEDVDVKSLVTAWLQQQPDDSRINIKALMDNFFFKAFEKFLHHKQLVVESSKFGIITSVLSHLKHVTIKGEFVCSLIRGFTSYLPVEDRVTFARDLFELCKETPSGYQLRPLDFYFNKEQNKFYSYTMSTNQQELRVEDITQSSIIHTSDVQRNIDIITPWIAASDPFILIGPEGCGKTSILRACVNEAKNVTLEFIYCNSQTKSTTIIQKIMDLCSIFTKHSGKVLKPKDGEKLVLVLKDINLPKPDKYETTEVIEFLQQLITYQGFYDQNLEWLSVEKIQIACTLNTSSTVERYSLANRFTSIVRIHSLFYPPKEQLETIYTQYISCFARERFSHHPIWKLNQNIQLLAQASVEFFEKVSSKFTFESHPHYIFSPRDITKWISNLLNYKFSKSTKVTELLDIWTYEARRIFKDRIVTNSHLYDSIEASIHKKFEHLDAEGYKNKLDNIVFSSNSNQETPQQAADNHRKLLSPITIKDYAQVVSKGLKSFERESRKLKLFTLQETIEYISKVERVLSQSGSLMLVGRAGVGRMNAVLLVCHMLRIELYSPRPHVDFSIKSFKEVLKQALVSAGIQGKPTCLLIEDHHLVDIKILEIVNDLLSSGIVVNLFSQEELEQHLSQLKEKPFNFVGSNFDYFVKRITENLKVVLSMDPLHPQFKIRCSSNPALFKQCCIIWIQSISLKGLARLPKAIINQDLQANISNFDQFLGYMGSIHEYMVSIGKPVASFQFVTFAETFKEIFSKKRQSLLDQQNRLKKGLNKIQEAVLQVDKLSKDAEVQKRLLAEKQVQKTRALEQIKESMELSVKETSDIEQIKQKISVEEEKLKEKESTINVKLAKILPILENAKQSVGLVEVKDLQEIRNYNTPPPAIKDVMEGVLRLLQISDTTWQGIKQFLMKKEVIQQIISFDPKSISKKLISEVQSYIDSKGSSFDEIVVAKSSRAVAPLAKWVKAIVEFAVVALQVNPLEEEMNQVRKVQNEYKDKLQQCENRLKVLNQKIKDLQVEFEGKTSEAETIRIGVHRAEKTLQQADSLLSKISGEKERWERQILEASNTIASLSSSSIIAAAYVVYLGDSAEDVRRTHLAKWLSMLNQAEFDLKAFLSSENHMLQFKSDGLPPDELSMENAIMLLEAQQSPLIIDPSQQATAWIRKKYKDKSLEIVTAQDIKLSTSIELSVRFGKTLLILEVDHILPVLFPILRKEIFTQGTRKTIYIGEKLIEYHEDFKLFLITRNPNIVISPEALPLLTVINFTVTISGLESQLLGITIQYENPELEKKKSDLLKREEDDKLVLEELENQLLKELADSKGNILENETLISSLNEIKSKSLLIMQSLEESKKLKNDLDTKRNAYKPFVQLATKIFFIIRDLHKINHMYQYDTATFLKLFNQTLEKSAANVTTGIETKVVLLCQNLQKIVYHFVSRSLFKEDLLFFATFLVGSIMKEKIGESLWNFFLFGDASVSVTDGLTQPQWMPKDRFSAFCSLHSAFPELSKKLSIQNDAIWQRWINSLNADADFPQIVAKSISAFEKLLVIKILRPDQLPLALNSFIKNSLAITSIIPPPMNFASLFKEETSPLDPILLITTPGADPSQELEETAIKSVGKSKFFELAMGQGQFDNALVLLRKCARNGDWLFLKNLHLVPSWLPVLEKELAILQPAEGFRLWLTSEASNNIPIVLLQQSLKITIESPPGIRNNLMRTYELWDEQLLSKSKQAIRSQLLFTLAWFHAIIQERRSYIPQGWSKFYEFTAADLRSAVDVVDSVCGTIGNNEPDWKTIHGLFESAIYGGKLDNSYDLKVLQTYLKTYFNPSIFDSTGKGMNNVLYQNIKAPSSNKHSDHVQVIKSSVPELNNPSLFGLPTNADKFVQTAISAKLIDKLQYVTSGSGEKSNEGGWNSKLLILIQLWKKLTSDHYSLLFGSTNNVKIEKTQLTPLQLCVMVELEQMTLLVQLIDRTLHDVNELIKGAQSVTSMNQISELVKEIVPAKWNSIWDGPEQLKSYLSQFVNKIIAIHSWKQQALSDSIFFQSVATSLKDLLHPSVFLNSLKQFTARVTNTPLDTFDTLHISFAMNTKNNKCKVKLKGLLLQGAMLENGYLVELQDSDSYTVFSLPECYLFWSSSNSSNQNEEITQQQLKVPLYQTLTREKFVAEIGMSTNQSDRLILAGIALFIDENW